MEVQTINENHKSRILTGSVMNDWPVLMDEKTRCCVSLKREQFGDYDFDKSFPEVFYNTDNKYSFVQVTTEQIEKDESWKSIISDKNKIPKAKELLTKII